MLRDAGVPHVMMAQDEGLIFVVRRAKMDSLRHERLDEVITIESVPLEMKAATATLRQSFAVGARDVAVLDVQLACVRRADGRPARIPPRWRTVFEEVTE